MRIPIYLYMSPKDRYDITLLAIATQMTEYLTDKYENRNNRHYWFLRLNKTLAAAIKNYKHSIPDDVRLTALRINKMVNNNLVSMIKLLPKRIDEDELSPSDTYDIILMDIMEYFVKELMKRKYSSKLENILSVLETIQNLYEGCLSDVIVRAVDKLNSNLQSDLKTLEKLLSNGGI